MAERVGFEPTVRRRITSFQDWLLKPLGHLSSLSTSFIIITYPYRFVKLFFIIFKEAMNPSKKSALSKKLTPIFR